MLPLACGCGSHAVPLLKVTVAGHLKCRCCCAADQPDHGAGPDGDERRAAGRLAAADGRWQRESGLRTMQHWFCRHLAACLVACGMTASHHFIRWQSSASVEVIERDVCILRIAGQPVASDRSAAECDSRCNPLLCGYALLPLPGHRRHCVISLFAAGPGAAAGAVREAHWHPHHQRRAARRAHSGAEGPGVNVLCWHLVFTRCSSQ